MHNLIMGTVSGYDIDQISPFLESLKASSIESDVLFLCNNPSIKVRDYMAKYHVKTISMPSMSFRGINRVQRFLVTISRQFESTERPNLILEVLRKRLWHCQAARYLFYLDILNSALRHWTKVMITDVRDVAFQADPFAHFEDDDLVSAVEYGEARIGDNHWNREWVRQLFGNEVLASLSTYPILCSGVTLGGVRPMTTYLKAMCEKIRVCIGTIGYDQGIHNYVCYSGEIPLKRVGFDEGPMMHVGGAPLSEIRLSADGCVMTRNGEICPIVHQYDRHESLTHTIRASTCLLDQD